MIGLNVDWTQNVVDKMTTDTVSYTSSQLQQCFLHARAFAKERANAMENPKVGPTLERKELLALGRLAPYFLDEHANYNKLRRFEVAYTWPRLPDDLELPLIVGSQQQNPGVWDPDCVQADKEQYSAKLAARNERAAATIYEIVHYNNISNNITV